MISSIIYSYLIFMPSSTLYPYHNNIKLIMINESKYHSRVPINNTYRRKIIPNEYGNLVVSHPLTASSRTNKDVKHIVNRVRLPTMIIDKVTDYVGFRNVIDYITWVYIAIAVLNKPHPPPEQMYVRIYEDV